MKKTYSKPATCVERMLVESAFMGFSDGSGSGNDPNIGCGGGTLGSDNDGSGNGGAGMAPAWHPTLDGEEW